MYSFEPVKHSNSCHCWNKVLLSDYVISSFFTIIIVIISSCTSLNLLSLFMSLFEPSTFHTIHTTLVRLNIITWLLEDLKDYEWLCQICWYCPKKGIERTLKHSIHVTHFFRTARCPCRIIPWSNEI